MMENVKIMENVIYTNCRRFKNQLFSSFFESYVFLKTIKNSIILARLIGEVRQLQGLGFQIPTKIIQCVLTGEKFYRHGVILKQVKSLTY